MEEIIRSKRRALVKIAWPISLQSILTVGMVMIDSVMVSGLGGEAISGMGIALAINLMIFSIQLGIANGTKILVAQAQGADSCIKKPFLFGIITNFSVSFFIFILIYFNLDRIIGAYTNLPEVLLCAKSFISINVFIIPITAITLTLGFLFRALGKTSITLKGFAIELPINLLLNSLLIYGCLGFPKMGLYGAALAGVLSRIFRLAYLSYKFIRTQRGILNQRITFIKTAWKDWVQYITIVGPFSISTFTTMLGTNIYLIIFSHLSLTEYTAYNLLLPIMGLVLTIINALASATSITLGPLLGAGKFNEANNSAKVCVSTTLTFIGLLAMLLVLCIPLYPYLYSWGKMTNNNIIQFQELIPFASILIMLRSYNIIISNGILRCGGDNKFPLQVDMFSLWCIGLPLCAVFTFVFHKSILWAFSAMVIEEVIKLKPLHDRYNGTVWNKTVTV